MRSPVAAALGSALGNAREAAGDIARAVYERAVLTTSLDPAGRAPPIAGSITRITTAEAMELLAAGQVGRLAYVSRAGVPDVVPVNYRVDGDAILISSGPGPKLQAADRRELVAFEVDDIDLAERTGWSVVAHGTARRLSPQERVELTAGGGAPEHWAGGPRHDVIRIDINRVAARRLH